MENILLHSTPLSELKNIIGQAIREELTNFKPEPATPATEREYLTRREVCDRLRVSLATLHYYTKDGTLKGYRIGGRVLYKSVEVEQAVQSIGAIKYKHRGE
jgi:excisionase family DNA binding protein